MNPFQSLREYEDFVYTLRQQYPSIRQSILVLIPRGRRLAVMQGEILFEQGFRLQVKERVSDETGQVVIETFGYEVWRDSEKLMWYDPQPHPHIQALQPTFPHHKHVPPDIKHNRVPATGINFNQPNLPLLIEEISTLIQELSR